MARPCVADQRREEILTAFEACVVRNGIDNTTLDDVAKEAGQPRSLVRYFVGNRAELVSLLIDRVLQRSEQQLKRLHTQGNDVRENLVDFLLGDLFSEPITGKLIAELWHLSVRSDPIRARLVRGVSTCCVRDREAGFATRKKGSRTRESRHCSRGVFARPRCVGTEAFWSHCERSSAIRRDGSRARGCSKAIT